MKRNPFPRFRFTSAKRIAERFGNKSLLVKALANAGYKYNPSTIYLWVHRVGVIPRVHIRAVMEAARLEGIVLTDADWSPMVDLARLAQGGSRHDGRR